MSFRVIGLLLFAGVFGLLSFMVGGAIWDGFAKALSATAIIMAGLLWFSNHESRSA